LPGFVFRTQSLPAYRVADQTLYPKGTSTGGMLASRVLRRHDNVFAYTYQQFRLLLALVISQHECLTIDTKHAASSGGSFPSWSCCGLRTPQAPGYSDRQPRWLTYLASSCHLRHGCYARNRVFPMCTSLSCAARIRQLCALHPRTPGPRRQVGAPQLKYDAKHITRCAKGEKVTDFPCSTHPAPAGGPIARTIHLVAPTMHNRLYCRHLWPQHAPAPYACVGPPRLNLRGKKQAHVPRACFSSASIPAIPAAWADGCLIGSAFCPVLLCAEGVAPGVSPKKW